MNTYVVTFSGVGPGVGGAIRISVPAAKAAGGGALGAVRAARKSSGYRHAIRHPASGSGPLPCTCVVCPTGAVLHRFWKLPAVPSRAQR